MLNELCQLADALDRAGISPKEWDPKLRKLPNATINKPCYRIAVAEDGSIAAIDTLKLDLVPSLRKWEPSNGSSFPGFNIQPLYRITGEEEKRQIKAWREGRMAVDVQLLRKWCTPEFDNWGDKIEKKLSKCLGTVASKLSGVIGNDDPYEYVAISKLLERVSHYLFSVEELGDTENRISFRKSLEKCIWSALECHELPNLLLPFLIHDGNADKVAQNDIEKDRGGFSVYLDIPDWKEYPAASPKMIEWINDQLVAKFSQGDEIGREDAFGGIFANSNEKFPSVQLPFIADVKLRAMNSASSCQYRYGTIDAVSFPVGQENRKKAKGALEWLADESRKGETWGRADIKELIFAYPTHLSTVSIKLAACFGAQKRDDSEARFANIAQDVIQGLRGATNDLRSVDVRIFSLKKVDKARTKVIFNRNYTAQRLVDAAQEWETGCANVPNIHIRAWGNKKGEWDLAELKTPFPLQVAQCLNRVWKLDGTTEKKGVVSTIQRTQGIELLLDEQPERFVPHLLSVCLQNGKGLMLGLGNDLHRGNIVSVKGYDNQRLLIPSLLGLLLHKLGIGKESYMNNAPFLVGRMLKLADELHALYCKEVRKDGELPSQLIGNTLMIAALDSPVQALAQLALRLKPYYGWAQTYKGNEDGNLPGYFVGQYGEVASQLVKQELPARFSDAERAQVLLGYLAANPKKVKTQTNTSEKKKKEMEV